MFTFHSYALSGTALLALAGCHIDAQLPTNAEGEHAAAGSTSAMHAAAGRGAVPKPGAGGGGSSSTRRTGATAGHSNGAAANGGEAPRPADDSTPDGAGESDDALPQAEPAHTPAAAADGGDVPNELLGGWYASSGGTSIPFNPDTGEFGMQNGSGLYYRFAADGSYQKAFQSYASNAGCTTGFHAEESGTMQVSDSTLSLIPDGGEIHYRDNCSPSLDSDRAEDNLSAEQFTWDLTADGLRLTRTDGATSVFVRTDE